MADLNVAGMGKNHTLAGAVADAAFGEIRRQFAYRAGRVLYADRFFPSSKRCSECGSVKDVLPLSHASSSVTIAAWSKTESATPPTVSNG